MKKISDFTEGRILPLLLKFSLPVLFAIVLQAMYGAVDLIVVGQFGTSADVSAVSTGSQIMHLITSVITGLSMGTTILLGQKIGEKKQHEAGQVVGSSIGMFAIFAVVLTTLMIVFSKQLAGVMNAPEEAFSKTISYIVICAIGLVFIVAYNVFGSIFRGIGDSKTPLITVGIACVINIAGDLLLVGVFNMGAAGAAIATVFAQAVGVVISLFIVKKRGIPFQFTKKDISFNQKRILHIFKVGCPIALQDGLVGVSFLVIMAIVNKIGLTASAGVGVAEKLCIFLMLIPVAFMQSMSAFVAQNIGAKKFDRAKKALYTSVSISIVIGIMMAGVSFFYGDYMTRIFTKDKDVVEAAFNYLRAYSIDCMLTSFLFCFIGFFNGCGKTTFVMIQGILGAFFIRIPVSYLFSKLEPVSLFRIGLATPISTAVQITLCMIYFVVIAKAMKKNNSQLKA